MVVRISYLRRIGRLATQDQDEDTQFTGRNAPSSRSIDRANPETGEGVIEAGTCLGRQFAIWITWAG